MSGIYGETVIDVFEHGGVEFEVLQVPETIWCGALGYAKDSKGEPDIEGLLERYQAECFIEKKTLAIPSRSCCISIDYWKDGKAPRGIMFAQQVQEIDQDPSHDVYKMPGSLYIRTAAPDGSGDLHLLFGVIRTAMAEHGYVISDCGAQEIEMYSLSGEKCYAYVPAMKL